MAGGLDFGDGPLDSTGIWRIAGGYVPFGSEGLGTERGFLILGTDTEYVRKSKSRLLTQVPSNSLCFHDIQTSRSQWMRVETSQ